MSSKPDIQETFSRIVEDINKAIEKFKEFFGIGLENAIKLAEKNIESLEKRLLNYFLTIFSLGKF